MDASEVFEAQFVSALWGMLAEQDPQTGSFRFPLVVTDVRTGSEAEDVPLLLKGAFGRPQVVGRGLEIGDTIVACKLAGADGFQNVVQIHSEAGMFVDKLTQSALERGGPVHLRVRGRPCCRETLHCRGRLLRCDDQSDSSIVCEECGVTHASRLATLGTEFEATQRALLESSEPIMRNKPASELMETLPFVRGARTSGRPGSGKDHAAARWERRMQNQHVKAKEDIARYCEPLGLSKVAQDEALLLFESVANIRNARLKNGACIDNYTSTVLGSVHCASLCVGAPRTIRMISAVADIGPGENESRVFDAVKRIRQHSKKRIPNLDAQSLTRVLCTYYLQLPIEMETRACSSVCMVKDALVRTCKDPKPGTVAAVTVVFAASRAAGVVDESMCSHASQACGLSEKTVRSHVITVLGSLSGETWS